MESVFFLVSERPYLEVRMMRVCWIWRRGGCSSVLFALFRRGAELYGELFEEHLADESKRFHLM